MPHCHSASGDYSGASEHRPGLLQPALGGLEIAPEVCFPDDNEIRLERKKKNDLAIGAGCDAGKLCDVMVNATRKKD
jgi:hypothetical protein